MDSHKEALKFMKEVKKAFLYTNDYDNKLGLFHSTLRTHKDGVISNEALVKTIKNLLEGHEHLLSWFMNKFVPKFAQTQTLVTDNQNQVEHNLGSNKRKCDEFLSKVKDRFGKDKPFIYSKVLDALIDYEETKDKIKLYTEFCTLFSGHADLFHEFESLSKEDMEDAKVELRNLRLAVREDFMNNVDVTMEQYKSTIKGVKEGADDLSAIHRRCIEGMYYMNNEDIGKKDLRNSFVTKMKEDPRGACNAILPRLEKKISELLWMKSSIVEFFEGSFFQPL